MWIRNPEIYRWKDFALKKTKIRPSQATGIQERKPTSPPEKSSKYEIS
jgi:hypothetical protein